MHCNAVAIVVVRVPHSHFSEKFRYIKVIGFSVNWLPEVNGKFNFENTFKENFMVLFELCNIRVILV